MKKLFAFLIVLLSLTVVTQAQVKKEVVLYEGTVDTSATITVYLDDLYQYHSDTQPKYWEMTDSVAVIRENTGELDIDYMIVTKGRKIGTTFYAVATPDTTTLTTNLAASTSSVEVTTAATIACSDMDEYSSIRFVIKSKSTDGSDITDPNKLKLVALKFCRYQIMN